MAAAAGVSITTVSHALNGKGRLTPQTRERVQAIATRMGYQPSALARGLAGGRTGMLALTVSFVDNPLPVADFDYFLQVMNAATSTALERGYSLTLLPAQSPPAILDRLPLDGAIVMDPVGEDPSVRRLTRRRIPIVTTGRQPEGPADEYWVDNDHVAGTRAMLDHLAEAGSRRVALLTVPVMSSYSIDVLRAYEQWCAERGQEPIVSSIPETLSESGAFAAATELLESPHPPDAIYGALDRLALGVLLAAEAKGIRVPEDLRVAGCTDSDASRSARPALTALNLNAERIGTEAVQLLVSLIEGEESPVRHRIVPSIVTPRASTRSAGKRRRAPATAH
ncbi:MAG TPA: LacI family DNA-binding transcriptional regulator [Solirubrobacteraceae bacterium]